MAELYLLSSKQVCPTPIEPASALLGSGFPSYQEFVYKTIGSSYYKFSSRHIGATKK